MSPNLEVKLTKNKGRGVYASKEFLPGEIIEVSPIIVISKPDFAFAEKTILDNYMYDWFSGDSCLPLGFGMLYNHSYAPNAKYKFNKKANTITYIALKPIHPGEEILVNYNGNPKSQAALDFQDVHYGGKMVVKE